MSPQLRVRKYWRLLLSGQPASLFEGPPEINGRFFYNDTLDGVNFERRRVPLTELFDRLLSGIGKPAAV